MVVRCALLDTQPMGTSKLVNLCYSKWKNYRTSSSNISVKDNW